MGNKYKCTNVKNCGMWNETETDRNITEICSVLDLKWQVKFLRTTVHVEGCNLCLPCCMFSGSQFVVMDFGICSAKQQQSLSLVQFWNFCFWRHIIWLITARKLLCYYWAKALGFLACSFVISLETQFHKWKFFSQNSIYFTGCFMAMVHRKPCRYFHNAQFIALCTICSRGTAFPISVIAPKR